MGWWSSVKKFISEVMAIAAIVLVIIAIVVSIVVTAPASGAAWYMYWGVWLTLAVALGIAAYALSAAGAAYVFQNFGRDVGGLVRDVLSGTLTIAKDLLNATGIPGFFAIAGVGLGLYLLSKGASGGRSSDQPRLRPA